MNTQKEQHVVHVPFGPGRNRPQVASSTITENAEKLRGAAGPMQSLAAELHQAALQGVFEYPRGWILVTKVTATLLVALAAFDAAMVIMPEAQESHWVATGLANWRTVGA